MSVILLNHNTYKLTCKCIRSIYDSNLDGLDIEIILVDNGSTEHYEKSFKTLFPDIIFIKSEVNVGFAKGNNLGLQHATKSYVLLLNSDTVITDPQTFIKSIEILNGYENKIVLTTRLLTADGKSQTAYGFLPSLPLEFFFTTFLYKLVSRQRLRNLLVTFEADKTRVIQNGYITATYYLFSKDLLDLLPSRKLYDGTFLYGEELFWATEWIRIGIKMIYFADVSIVHFVGQSTSRLKNYNIKMRRMYQIKAEHQYLQWRYNKTVVLLIYFLRLTRFVLLSPFDKDIRMRLLLLMKVILIKPKSNE